MPVQDDNKTKPERRSFLVMLFGGVTTQSLIQTAGFVFAIVGALALIYAVYKIISSPLKSLPADQFTWQNIIGSNIESISLVIIAALSAMIALRLFSKAGSLTSQVIRDQDRKLLEPLISSANKDAIGEYIRLASLSGFTGTFQYLGFTGLPLATVALTLILLGTSLLVKDPDMQKSVFDLAKLTLGAFLGSFVQRNLETEKLTQGQQGSGTGGGGSAPSSDADDRASIGKELDKLAGQAQTLRKAADDKLSAVAAEKQPQVEAVRAALAEIEKKIDAARTAVLDTTQPIDKVRTASSDAEAAAAKIDDLTELLNAI